MNKYDLSVLIPARNEMFLANTVESILKAKRGKTEVIVVLDGAWAEPGIPDHPDVTIIYNPQSVGQRAATNQACRLSKAKYVMKLDAHCALSDGFDVDLIESMEGHPDWTMVPKMYNLHAFDWVCYTCGHRIYQGPTPGECPNCKRDQMAREMIWKPRLNKESLFYRFDHTLHFQYHGDRKHDPEAQGDIAESMSIQGSCFVLTREKYWELNISEEALAGKSGWGQQGVEVALKTWLSGGKVMINKKPWYAHMFRTQGGDFGFPYPLSNSEVEETRNKSRDLWLNNKWPQQIYPLSWLIHKFNTPHTKLKDWFDEKGKDMLERVEKAGEEFYKNKPQYNPDLMYYDLKPTKGIIFYTDNKLKLSIAHKVQKQLKKMGLPIVSASLKPMNHFGKNVHIKMERGVDAYFNQIISALETLDTDIVFFCEHDVIYHPSHFDFTPPRDDMFYYNQNFWRVREDGFAVHWDANQVSGLVCYRKYALDWYKNRYEEIKQKGFNRSYEPGGRNPDKYVVFKSEFPNIDVRHGSNLTKSKWSPDDFRDKSTCINWQEGRAENIPGWKISSEDHLPVV